MALTPADENYLPVVAGVAVVGDRVLRLLFTAPPGMSVPLGGWLPSWPERKDDRACPRRSGHPRRLHARGPPGSPGAVRLLGASGRASRSRRPEQGSRAQPGISQEIAGQPDIFSLLCILGSGAGDKCQYSYLGRISSWSFAARTGPEFSEAGRGTYQLEQIPLTAAGTAASTLNRPRSPCFCATRSPMAVTCLRCRICDPPRPRVGTYPSGTCLPARAPPTCRLVLRTRSRTGSGLATKPSVPVSGRAG